MPDAPQPSRRDPEPLEICSFRTVFDLERRIYRIDRLRLNPQGVPVRGIVYALALMAGGGVAGRLPGLGSLLAAMPWYLRDVGLPVGLAALLGMLRIDGRPFHLFARALLRRLAGPRWLSGLAPAGRPGGVWVPPDVVSLPDGSDAFARRLRFRGPGAVLVAAPHERRVWTRGLAARGLRRADITLHTLGRPAPGGRAQVLEVAAGTRLETRGGSR